MDETTLACGLSGTQSIQRAATLLKLLASHDREGMRLVDLHRGAGLERPTAHRILQSLVSERLVRQDTKSRRYFLGSLVHEMGLAATPRSALRDICHWHLLHIASRSGDTAFLTERSGLDGVCIDRAEGAFPVKTVVLQPGSRRPLNVGAGALAILAGLPDDEIDRICAANRERTLQAYPRYREARAREEIALARQRGYTLHDVLSAPGLRAIAVALHDAQGRPIAALSISSLSSRLERDRAAELAAYLADAARAITQVITRT
jgi:DNA-binding IclR family transcriptional regulator